MQCKNDYLDCATMAILALTIVLTAYQYHEYCFFTLKTRMHTDPTLDDPLLHQIRFLKNQNASDKVTAIFDFFANSRPHKSYINCSLAD